MEMGERKLEETKTLQDIEWDKVLEGKANLLVENLTSYFKHRMSSFHMRTTCPGLQISHGLDLGEMPLLAYPAWLRYKQNPM